jgi:putative ATPase
VISALLSRSRVYVLNPLTEEQIVGLLQRALQDEPRGLGALELQANEDALAKIAAYASGDARSAYNALEVASTLAVEANQGASGGLITESIVETALQKRVLRYDKAGEEHYNLISALHKSVRNSDPDATLYWLGRMIESGEDPLYIARRLMRMAVEDVGLADPHALQIAVAARDAVDFIGMPEGNLALAEAAVYMAIAPKSNALYTAYGAVQRDVEQTAADPVPLHLRNAPTRLMKEIGYGQGYQYAHDLDEKVADMQCLPDNLRGRVYYRPTAQGVEKRIQDRLAQLRESRAELARRNRVEKDNVEKEKEA